MAGWAGAGDVLGLSDVSDSALVGALVAGIGVQSTHILIDTGLL
jgi:NH3-dependent NAD+ synthetase